MLPYSKDQLPLLIGTLCITFSALANLVRFLWNIPVAVGSFQLPGWTGGIAFVVLGLLAAWMFQALGLYPPKNPKDPYMK